MYIRWLGMILVVLGLGAPASGAPAPRDDDRDRPEGVDVQLRGPVHEAYAGPVDARPQPSPLIEARPPEAVDEVPSDQRPDDEDAVWIAGYWAWDEERDDFLWVSGLWRVPPPGRQWMPGHWTEAKEGYQWSAGFWSQGERAEVEYLPPPPAPIDAAASTPAPDANHVYTPGCWVYRATRYAWRPGFWVAPRPGWLWTPAHYCYTPSGYVFLDGYWDRPLEQRGLLFAPVYIGRAVLGRPRWHYQPRYAVYPEFLTSALFVRRSHGHYYFGDYFDRRYERSGFQPWIDVRVGRSGYDPLFSYYRWRHREGRWGRDLRDVYAARREREDARPPRTLVQQNTLIQNITDKKVTNKVVNNNLNNVRVVAPVTKFESRAVKLRAASREQRERAIQSVQQAQQVRKRRAQAEADLVGKGRAARPGDRPRVARVELPRAAPARPRTGERAPPPAPKQPRDEAKQPPRDDRPPPRPEVIRPKRPRDGRPPARRDDDRKPPRRDAPPPRRDDNRPPRRGDDPPKRQDKEPGPRKDKDRKND